MGDQKTLRVTQIRSAIKRQKKQQQTLDALVIRRIRHTVEHADSPQLRGMLATVAHLVKVEET
ncbi:MAG: 50S ribosomal protein L30 [Gemmatimonadota bacterium]|nr:50S ribosomal protein L30 [Gemmatimonadota bacterium]